mmetsp:Transcript_6576/g.12089  ORF Transcript_6576/g.12089 Transcript_6576/m.12089 type:complete len:456 (-) Transcript_6576:746-2113(-)
MQLCEDIKINFTINKIKNYLNHLITKKNKIKLLYTVYNNQFTYYCTFCLFITNILSDNIHLRKSLWFYKNFNLKTSKCINNPHDNHSILLITLYLYSIKKKLSGKHNNYKRKKICFAANKFKIMSKLYLRTILINIKNSIFYPNSIFKPYYTITYNQSIINLFTNREYLIYCKMLKVLTNFYRYFCLNELLLPAILRVKYLFSTLLRKNVYVSNFFNACIYNDRKYDYFIFKYWVDNFLIIKNNLTFLIAIKALGIPNFHDIGIINDITFNLSCNIINYDKTNNILVFNYSRLYKKYFTRIEKATLVNQAIFSTSFRLLNHQCALSKLQYFFISLPSTGSGCSSIFKKFNNYKFLNSVSIMKKIQLSLLNHIIKAIRKNKSKKKIFLYYSNSIFVEENEEIINQTIKRNKIRILDTKLTCGNPGLIKYKEKVFDTRIKLSKRFYPHTDGIPGIVT